MVGTGNPDYLFDCKTTDGDDFDATYMARFWNDGGATNSQGIIIQCGHDSGSGSETYDGHVFIKFADGNGDAYGYLYGNDVDGGQATAGGLYISDERLKENITDTTFQGLSMIEGIKLRDFNWKTGGKRQVCGVISQEVTQVFPKGSTKIRNEKNTITGEPMYGEYIDDDTIWTVSNESFIMPLIKAVQELSAKVTALEAQI